MTARSLAMTPLLSHVDGSGRGLDDGDCIHCGQSGSLGSGECEARLRDRVTSLEQGLRSAAELCIRVLREHRPADAPTRGALYNVAEVAFHLRCVEDRV